MSGIVDWGLAERAAAAVVAGVPGIGRGSAPDPYSAAEVEGACAEALAPVVEYTGLGAVGDPPRPELIDRRAWATNALGTLADAAEPIERRLAEDLSFPGPLGSLARRAAGAALGTEAGLAAGYAARRVLGQYDVAVIGAARAPRLLFVAENLAAARASLDADRDSFLRWVALHETAHVVQFARIEWLAAHVRSLARGLIDGAADGVDAGGLTAVVRRLLRDPRDVIRALMRGEFARLLADPERRELLDRLQATMSVVEGHAEHVMDACAPELGIDLTELRARLDERRARSGGLGEIVARLLGMDLKARQYEVGKAFCDRVVAEAGTDSLRLVWRSPGALPDAAELEAPGAWLERVAAVPA